MSSIYGLMEEHTRLMDVLLVEEDTETGEVPPELDASLEALGDRIADKIEACGYVLLRMRADAAALRDEERRLAARRRRIEAGRERLAERVRDLLEQAGMSTVRGAGVTVTLATAAQRVDIVGPVPEQYLVTPDPRPDVAGIRAAIRSGAAVPGAMLVPGIRPLRVS